MVLGLIPMPFLGSVYEIGTFNRKHDLNLQMLKIFFKIIQIRIS